MSATTSTTLDFDARSPAPAPRARLSQPRVRIWTGRAV